MAENNNFWVDLIANLKKSQSKKQIQSDAKNLGDIFVPLIGKLNKSKTKAQIQKDLQSIDGSVNVDTKVNKKNIVVSVQNALKQAQSVANKNKVKIDATFDIKKSKLLADIKYFGQQNSKLFKDANMASKYNSLLDNAKLATSNKEIKNLRLQLSALRSEIRSTGQAGLTLGDTLRKTFKRAAELFTGTGFMMLATQQLKQAWQEAMNLDKSFTSLVKVQDELTRSDYPDYLDQCNKKAKELATTQQALIDGATEFSKSGYDLTTSNKLSEQSAILSNVGEMQASESAKAIISGVQAYEVVDGYTDAVDKAQALIDKYNEIGNTASITTEEIAKGVQSVGSVFADANTSVDEFIALLAAGNRQFQDADSLALGLRTAALRIRGCTVELEQMGEETDGVYTSASKLQEKIADLTNINGSGGVKILEADGETFRSIYDIFVDLSKVYKEMSDTDQSALLELIAGKHRASSMSATLNNMSEAQEIYKRSLESAGSAQEEYNTYLESSEASLNRFKASMTEAYQSVIDGSTTKGILDAANSTLEFANSIGLVESVLKGFIAISAVKGITALSVAFKASAIEASNFGTALNTVKNMESMIRGTTEYANALNSLKSVSVGLKEAQLKQILANKALDNSTRISILRATGLTKAQAQAKLSQMSLTQSTKAQTVAQNSATASTFSLTAAIRGFGVSLKAAFMSNPVGISIMALSTVIGAVTSKISEHNEAVREARQANMDAASSIREETDELNNLYIKYKNLSSVTDKTSQQEEDFKQVVQDITEALGSKAEVLEGLTAGTDRYTESLEKATKAELESQYATAKIGAKAAEEALKDKTYSSWSGSQITIAKNEQMTGIKEHVAALETVEDILAKYEDLSSNGVEWKPINWDENRNDMNAVIEYYYSLIEAREKLVTSDNADFLMTSDIYKDINTTINDLKDSVENYTEQQYEALKLNYEWQNGIPTTKEELDAMEQSILNASGAGEQFQNVLKGFLTQDFSSLVTQVDNTGEEVKATEQAITSLFDKLTSSKESLDKFTSSVESAYESYAKLMNPNVSSSDILSSIQSITSAISDMGGSLNWEFIDGQANSLDLLGAAIEDVSRKYAESILSGAGIDIDSKFGQMLADNIIQAQKASTELENLNSNIDSLQSAYSDLTSIVEAYNETGYLTFDQLQTLLDLEPQYLACLVDENGQLQLNEQAMTALANQRLNDAEAQAVQQAITELGQLALQDEKTAVEENGTAFYNAISKLAGYNQELSTTIAEATVGASVIRDLNAAINNAESQGASDDQINTVLNNLNTKLQAIGNVRDKLNSGGLGDIVGGATSSASSAGKEAGDAYLEAFEEEYQKLKDKLDRGEITEKEYLDNLRELYERYFRDREKYLDEFQKYEQEYLEGMESLYGEVIDYICDMLDKQADKYSDLKDSTVDAYKAQKEAAEEAIEAQIEAIEAEIDAKQKQADAIQDEIDKIKEAREERQKQLDLQKKEYELQRMQNQRTQLTYTSEKGFIYTADTQGIRDAREEVDEAKEDLYIMQLEKQIDLINDEIDALEERKDALEKQKQASNEYYESLISSTEEYYDKLIESLDDTKSRWQELADLKEEAEMKSKMESILEQYGVTADDVVNMSEEAFNAFKNDYLGLLSDLYSGNEQMQSAIAETAGTTTDKLGSYIASTQEYIDSLSSTTETLQPVADAINTASESMDNLSTSASTASESTSQIASDMETLNTNSDGVSENINGISDALTSIPDSSKFDSITTSFKNLGDAIKDVATALGVGEEGTVGGLVGALQEISELSIGGEGGTGILTQFQNLKTAVEEVTSAIGGGMGTENGNTGGTSGQGGNAESGGASNLVGAIQELQSTADESLGGGGEEGSGDGEEGGEGVIGKFNTLKTAVDAVTMAIGTGEEEGNGEEGATNLIGALKTQFETATEILPQEKALFDELLSSIMACVDALNNMGSAIGSLPGIGGSGSIGVGYKGTVGNAFASGTTGTRNLPITGYKGLPKSEKNALRSEYGQPELTVYPDGTTELTTEPTMSDLPKDTVIFNEEQTKRIMNNEGTVIGNAHANGTDDGTIVTKDGVVLRPLQEGDKMYEYIKKFEAYSEKLTDQIVPPVNAIEKNMETIAKNINNVNTSNVNKPSLNVGSINVTCPGVTSKEVMNQVGTAIQREIGGIYLEALQEANITR